MIPAVPGGKMGHFLKWSRFVCFRRVEKRLEGSEKTEDMWLGVLEISVQKEVGRNTPNWYIAYYIASFNLKLAAVNASGYFSENFKRVKSGLIFT